MIKFNIKGDWSKTIRYLDVNQNLSIDKYLNDAGQKGVVALSQATPIRTGLAASSWSYNINKSADNATVEWHNSDVEGGCNVAILIQYGHGTRNGAYVQGIDYINPAIRPVFDELAENIWKEVNRA